MTVVEVERALPRVSVIMRIYDGERYVAAALDSVLAQTVRDFELIVVDDGSTDGGVAIVERYAARDSCILLLRQKNAGVAAARNAAIAIARGDALAFIDADDLWVPRKLELQLPHVSNDTLVYGAEYKVWESDPERPPKLEKVTDEIGDRDPLRCLLRVNTVHGPNTVMLGRTLVLEHGGFDETVSGTEDFDLWLRLAADGVRFLHIAEPLGVYRIRDDSISDDPASHVARRLRIFRKLYHNAPPGLGTRLAIFVAIQRARHRLSVLLGARGYNRMTEGKNEQGRQDLRQAVHVFPYWFGSWLLAAILVVPGAAERVARARAARHRAVYHNTGRA